MRKTVIALSILTAFSLYGCNLFNSNKDIESIVYVDDRAKVSVSAIGITTPTDSIQLVYRIYNYSFSRIKIVNRKCFGYYSDGGVTVLDHVSGPITFGQVESNISQTLSDSDYLFPNWFMVNDIKILKSTKNLESFKCSFDVVDVQEDTTKATFTGQFRNIYQFNLNNNRK